MRNNQGYQDFANLLIEQHGPDARDNARTTEELLSYLPGSRDRTSIIEAVRVMEALMSMESQTIH